MSVNERLKFLYLFFNFKTIFMADLSTTYLGLKLRNPIIASSSGLTNSIDHILELESNNAGAVVIKSIFEEQIRYETERLVNSDDESMSIMKKGLDDVLQSRAYDYADAMQYLSNFAKEHTLKEYLTFITELKKQVKIPIIASVNCVSVYDWNFFAKRIQDAGADALELNIYILPSDITKTSVDYEAMYFNIIENVKKHVSIPVSFKLSYYSSSLSNSLINLSNKGLAGMVLFNKPYNPDIDIKKIEVSPGHIQSSSLDYARSLRWIAILSGRVNCDLAASTGVHDYETVVKLLLAGAHAVQVASVLYENGIGYMNTMVEGLNKWMDEKNFKTIEEFRGKLSQTNAENPAVFERVQFMKYYSDIK